MRGRCHENESPVSRSSTSSRMTPFNRRTQRQNFEQEITEIAKGLLLLACLYSCSKAAQNPKRGGTASSRSDFQRRHKDRILNRRLQRSQRDFCFYRART